MRAGSVDPNYFVELYRRERDPWNFETSEYESEKYARSLSVLREAYADAFEIGCSIGVFTAKLAGRCERLLAMDVSPDALATARERCAAMPHVRFALGAVPDDFPRDERFDLVTLCEVGFYLDAGDLRETRDAVVTSLKADGHVLLVHWTPPVRGHALGANEVHQFFDEIAQLKRVAHHDDRTYRLDLWQK